MLFDDLQVAVMRHDVFDHFTKRVGDKETHGQARGVGRQAQDVKARVLVAQAGEQGVQVKGQAGANALGKGLQRAFGQCAAAGFAVFPVQAVGIKQAGEGRFCLAVFAFGPENHGGIADADLPIGVAAREQVVERRAVGEGRPHAGGGVQAFFVFAFAVVRAEGGQVEPHQGGAGGLGAVDALDVGVQPGDGGFFAGHQILHDDGFLRRLPRRPGLTNGRVFMHESAVVHEHDVATFEQVL